MPLKVNNKNPLRGSFGLRDGLTCRPLSRGVAIRSRATVAVRDNTSSMLGSEQLEDKKYSKFKRARNREHSNPPTRPHAELMRLVRMVQPL